MKDLDLDKRYKLRQLFHSHFLIKKQITIPESVFS